MATLNLSLPDELKRRFFAAFPDENKSALLAQLIEHAIEDAESKQRRNKVVRTLLRDLDKRPQISAKQLRNAREAGRP